MDPELVVSSFGRFLTKQQLCEKATWEAFKNHVIQQSKLAPLGDRKPAVADLRYLIKELTDILKRDSYETENSDDTLMDSPQPSTSGHSADVIVKAEPEDGEHADDRVPLVDPNLVQITADKAEIDRRVAAFLDHKRVEVNEGNIREFRSAMSSEQVSESSARTDATFLRRPDSKSRVQVSRVVNHHGPQTRCHPSTSLGPDGDPANPRSVSVTEALEERLSNMEEHVGAGTDLKKTNSIYKRLKALEERILYLESLSPEYFNEAPAAKSRRMTQDIKQSASQDDDLSLVDINGRISALRKSLGLRDV